MRQGKPVAKAKVTPWAFRSSQGHGWWRKGDEEAGVGPTDVLTDKDGNATVLYPKYRDVQEQIRTLAVSLSIDHADFAYIDAEHIDVPLETKGPYEIKLAGGVPLEIRPLLDNKPADLEDLFALWSDGRSWRPGAAAEKLPDGTLRIPAMPPGKNSVLLVKLAGERATHFSKITDLDLKEGERKKIDVPLLPSAQIEGVLSDNVPRPIHHGRIKVWTLAPAAAERKRVEWFSWTPIRPMELSRSMAGPPTSEFNSSPCATVILQFPGTPPTSSTIRPIQTRTRSIDHRFSSAPRQANRGVDDATSALRRHNH